MPDQPRQKIEDLERDRRPMLMLLGSIAAAAVTLTVIAYNMPEKTGSPDVARTAPHLSAN